MMPDFNIRSTIPEIMDDLTCSGEVVEQTLRELDFINKWLGGDQVTLEAVAMLIDTRPSDQEICIADLGCGSGTLLARVAAYAKKKNRKVKLIGIDANPSIIAYATRNNRQANIEFIALDIFSPAFAAMKFDIVMGTLFFHHFSNQQLSDFFKMLGKQTRVGFIVNDIHRHPMAYYLIKWLTSIFSKSAMVKFDAPVSVLRAFKRYDWKVILDAAELSYSLKWKWAFRWQLVVLS